MTTTRTAGERVERAIAVLGAVALSLGLLLSDIPVPTPAEAVPAIPGCGDRSAESCAEEGRRLAETDLVRGAARYFIFGEVFDIAEPQRVLAAYGVELLAAGCLCCDPLLVGYNAVVLEDLMRRSPGFAMPLLIY
jgi:hypothetical protein